VGGLISGLGFIIGGSCPGTTGLLATFKIDGLFFALGGLFGIFLFGDIQYYEGFWNGSHQGFT
jgi:hypothetical protein